jgi:superfamily II DNA or RNA helicase/HKD family nuclease/diadenosine tetraphosphate (Ap4A) HIT family hydrolase
VSSVCPFCELPQDRVIWADSIVAALWDGFPVSPGHALIVPRRHVATWFDASSEEQTALVGAIGRVRGEILKRHAPDGFNIGINVGEAAGQTVFHLHLHVIPRYRGDVPNPRGGVRRVIPQLADYTAAQPAGHDVVQGAPHSRPLVRGGEDPLLPHLYSDLDRAVAVDMAVSFILRSGVRLIREHLRDLLRRGGRLRIITGDYLDVTEPDALRELLDIKSDAPFELRVFEAGAGSFHPKSFIFHFEDGSGTAYVGSSNLTEPALKTGIEWNYRVITSGDPQGFAEVQRAFEHLFRHSSSRLVDYAWIGQYETRRGTRLLDSKGGVPAELPDRPPSPHPIQAEALERLEATRRAGNSAGLVVLATGLGKTWLSAFDSKREEFQRILFVAHREEILDQALATFRQVRRSATFGRYDGKRWDASADILFASIQTLGKSRHLEKFAPESFDYVIVDEFHHAAARTYRNLLDHFRPKFLLGLTATPERMDGGDLLALCQENLVFRCDAFEGIDQGLLCPFTYFGVPDTVDYAQIPWRNSRFDEEALTQAVATQRRAENALEQYRKRAGKRTLSFCVSQRHADFMASFFSSNGIRAVAVHAGGSSAPRAASLEKLAEGEIDVIFAVDMFNEGLDVPAIDTVLMLRPTESIVIWQQQFGRGLRLSKGKERLCVIDYIGNHRMFLTKVCALLRLPGNDYEIERALNLLREGALELPEGCEVTYDLEVVETIRSLLRSRGSDSLRAFYEDFRERYGTRPTATEMFHEGHRPEGVRRGYGSWLGFIRAMGDFSDDEAAAERQHHRLLKELETTPMTKSFKMLTLQAMLNLDRFPGEVGIESLLAEFRRLAARSAELTRDVGPALRDDAALRRLIETNPISAWTGGQGTGGQQFFRYEGGVFSTAFSTPPELRRAIQELVREIVDWRLAQYLFRLKGEDSGEAEVPILCKVSLDRGGLVLSFPQNRRPLSAPLGWAWAQTPDGEFEARFARSGIDALRRAGGEENVLSDLLRKWCGPDAGLAGTRHFVALESIDGGWRLSPEQTPNSGGATAVELWKEYERPEIPGLFGLKFNTGSWNQGFVRQGDHIFFLITLEKDDLQEDHRYKDRFLSTTLFECQTQNRTRRDSTTGELLKNHAARGVPVHLFVRKTKKIYGRAAGFVYCGDVQFVDWEGDEPITIRWRLPEALPERLVRLFGIAAGEQARL